METFQIEKNSQNTPNESIQTQVFKPHHDRNKEINYGKNHAKSNIGGNSDPTAFERKSHAIEKIVNDTASDTAQYANEKSIYLVGVRHLNSL